MNLEVKLELNGVVINITTKQSRNELSGFEDVQLYLRRLQKVFGNEKQTLRCSNCDLKNNIYLSGQSRFFRNIHSCNVQKRNTRIEHVANDKAAEEYCRQCIELL